MADIVTSEARAILDALQPNEWYTTDREDTIVVSLDGNTALRLVVTPTPLPAVSPYDSDDNRYPEGLKRERGLTLDPDSASDLLTALSEVIDRHGKTPEDEDELAQVHRWQALAEHIEPFGDWEQP